MCKCNQHPIEIMDEKFVTMQSSDGHVALVDKVTNDVFMWVPEEVKLPCILQNLNDEAWLVVEDKTFIKIDEYLGFKIRQFKPDETDIVMFRKTKKIFREMKKSILARYVKYIAETTSVDSVH